MTTVIEENQVNAELQELYLISKQWISDLEFFARDLSFLQKLVDRACSQLNKHEMNEGLNEMKLTVSNLQNHSREIKDKVINHLALLESLNNSRHIHGLGLTETHSLLEREISSLLQNFKSVKQRVYKLTSERIKTINSKS